MSSQDINPIASHDSEDRDRGSNKLVESPVVLQNHVKLLDEYHLLLISAVGSFINSQAMTRSEGTAGLKSIILIVFVDFNMRLFVTELDIVSTNKVYSMMSRFVGLGTYIQTVTVVMEAYALLLVTNIRYIRIAIIPVVILVFIGALCSKFWENHSSEYNKKRDASLRNGTKSSETLMKMAMVPYCLQLSFVILTQYSRKQDGIFIFSGFLLFFNSALGALAVMIATPPVAVSPGVVQVLPVLHKTCIIMLLITTHTMTAEWLGEDIIFACMPELVAVLVWFTVRFDHGGHAVSVRSVTLRKSGLVILSSVAAILAYLIAMPAHDRKILSWYRRAFCISSSSSALSYFHVLMLHQWPESTSKSNGPIEVLKISTKICLCMTAILSVPLVYTWTLDGISSVAALVLLLLILAIFRRRLSSWGYRILAFWSGVAVADKEKVDEPEDSDADCWNLILVMPEL